MLGIKREPKHLADCRELVIDELEVIEETLRLDYLDLDSWEENRPEPIAVRYPRVYAWQRGDAWAHLLRHPPIIQLTDGREFRPVIGEKYHPYRKHHTAAAWIWRIMRWEQLTSVEVSASVVQAVSELSDEDGLGR